MAKRYYWLKLMDDFFTQPRMKKLRKIAGGDTYTIIYLKMMLLSINDGGKLYFEGVEDNFIDDIALRIDEESDNVKFTVMFLLNQGLMECVQEGEEYLLPEAVNSIGSETDKAAMMRNLRDKRREVQEIGNNVTPQLPEVTKSYTDIEKDIDTEKDKEKKERKKKKASKQADYDQLISEYTQNQDLIDAFGGYIQMRTAKKNAPTNRALSLVFNELDKLAKNDGEKVAILNQSTMRGWIGVFPIKHDTYNKNNMAGTSNTGMSLGVMLGDD